ncbi:MarR family winged helix-turn-helix transcriptional regulator [Mycobacterium sp. pUA109]|uniref:MarR family winged helix-turn-helix transcriptional regulator n=1 Tax=Mycobacterium sp. pUA109 TaxID=3238982 RepID=UPI00351B7A06
MSEQCPRHEPAGITGSPQLDPAEQRCLDSFLDSATRLYMALDRRLGDAHGLSFFDVRLLQVLYEAPDGWMRMSDLAAETMLLMSRVSHQIRRLEAQGWVRRRAGVADRRSVTVSLTPAGRRRTSAVQATFGGLVRAHFLSPLSRAQMSALGHSCYRVSAALQTGQPNAVLSGVQ